MSATVQGIFIGPSGGEPLVGVPEARVLPGQGLEGDRYALGLGCFSRWPATGREVTLIEGEVIEEVARAHGLDLREGRSRRNIVTAGMRLGELMGKTFQVGTALLRGDRPADPCAYLGRLVGPGVMEALRGRGGLRATILREGVVRVGDAIEVPTSP
jgi:MOSC domain-containing protein YiiM